MGRGAVRCAGQWGGAVRRAVDRIDGSRGSMYTP